MNTIIYCGYGFQAPQTNDCDNENVLIICAAQKGKAICNGVEKKFADGDIALLPLASQFELSGADKSLCAVIEDCTLPVKGLQIASDIAGAVAKTLAATETYFTNLQNKRDLVLTAAGNLVIAAITSIQNQEGLSPIVCSIKCDIENSLSDPEFSLQDYLKTLPLNYDYLRKLYKAETGFSPHEYLIGKRMELAASILQSAPSNKYSPTSLARIAGNCGYNDALYFSRVFRRYYGVSPTEYAKGRRPTSNNSDYENTFSPEIFERDE